MAHSLQMSFELGLALFLQLWLFLFWPECSVIDVRSLTLVPKITRSGETSPAVSAASSDRGSGKRGGLLRGRKQNKEAAPAQAAPATQEEDVPSPSLEEAPVVRDQATRGTFSIQTEKNGGVWILFEAS